MQWVLLAAGVISVATLVGTAVGYLFKNVSQRGNDAVIGFSSGVMLCAAVFGLIEPSIEYGGRAGVFLTSVGIFCGALFLCFVDRLTPRLNAAAGIREGNGQGRVLLFVAAIAIHHFPEGIAAGVSFGTQNASEIIMVCGGIAIQNLPEAAVIIAPMLNSGVSRRKAFVIALISGGMEVLGTFFGYFAVSIATAIMPFALAFAGGSMIYIIIDEMVPQTHCHSFGGTASFSALGGFCIMLMLDSLIDLVVA